VRQRVAPLAQRSRPPCQSPPWPTGGTRVSRSVVVVGPENGDITWRRLQYVFRLPDPHAFPPLGVTWNADESEMLSQYVRHAEKLAGASLLGASDTVTVHIADDNTGEEIDAKLSAEDVWTGFGTMLRQCYDPNEEASFARVRKLLANTLYERSDTDRGGVIRQWRKAQTALAQKALEEHVQERMIEDGLMPGPEIVQGPESPHQLLDAFWNGRQIHWGDQREKLAYLQRDAFHAAWSEIWTRQAANDLAHIYIGFAVLVRKAAS
jgi:hypothetical protein